MWRRGAGTSDFEGGGGDALASANDGDGQHAVREEAELLLPTFHSDGIGVAWRSLPKDGTTPRPTSRIAGLPLPRTS